MWYPAEMPPEQFTWAALQFTADGFRAGVWTAKGPVKLELWHDDKADGFRATFGDCERFDKDYLQALRDASRKWMEQRTAEMKRFEALRDWFFATMDIVSFVMDE